MTHFARTIQTNNPNGASCAAHTNDMLSSSNNPMLEPMRRLLPFMSELTNPSDLSIYIAQFRKLYAQDPHAVDEAYDLVLDELKQRLPADMVNAIDDVAGAVLDSMPIAIEEGGMQYSLHAAGFLAYALANAPLRTERLTKEKADAFRQLLFSTYFDERACDILVYENLMPLTHRVVADAVPAYDFLRMMASAGTPFVPQNMSVDMPGYDANYDEEDASDIAQRFRLVLFAVRSKKGSKLPALKRPYELQGFSIQKSGGAFYGPDVTLSTPWGKGMSAWLQDFGGQFRYYVTEPYLLNDAVRQLDYIVGLHRVILAATRTSIDLSIPASELQASFGVFTDPLKGYAELRVAFARTSAPDVLLSGVPLPLPPYDPDSAGREIMRYVEVLLAQHGIPCPDPETYACTGLVAEPDTVDRLYNTAKGEQKTIAKRAPAMNASQGSSNLLFN